MHRSGTSLCANVLHELGVDIAEAAGPSASNQRGHWERPRINDLHDAALAIFSRGWDTPTHHLALPVSWWTDRRVDAVRSGLVAYLRRGMAHGRPFGFKDPRTSRLLAMWPQILDELSLDPTYVFCVRNPAQVARSITARDQLEGEQAVYRWLIYNAQAVQGVGGARVCVIGYETWFSDAAMTLDRLARFVGLPARQELTRVVDSGLRHDRDSGADPVPPVAMRLYEALLAAGERFDARLLDLADTILGCERAVMPFLRDAALLPLSIAEQNRVIGDLHGLVERLRGAT